MKRVAALALLAVLQEPAGRTPWLGISMTLEKAVPEVEGKKYPHAIRVHDVVPESSADRAGLLPGDLVVEIEGFDMSDADTVLARLREYIGKRRTGETLAITVVRDEVKLAAKAGDAEIADPEAWQNPKEYLRRSPVGTRLRVEGSRQIKILTLSATLLPRPLLYEPARIPPNAGIWKDLPPSPVESYAARLRAQFQIENDYQDLLNRLGRLYESADPFRLRRAAFAHRSPFHIEPVAQRCLREVTGNDWVDRAAEWLDRPPPGSISPEVTADDLDSLAAGIESALGEAERHRAQAFQALSPEQRKFAMRQIDGLSTALLETVVPGQDSDRVRRKANAELFQLSLRVDYAELFAAARIVEHLACRIVELRSAIEAAWEKRGKPERIFFDKGTKYGKIVVSGKGNSKFAEDVAVSIDLGGNDFYVNNAGSSRGDALPFAIAIDFEGDDAYEATVDGVQGTGWLGVGILIDRAGNDSYIGRRWAQGAAVMGVGLLQDSEGRDTYRAWEMAQAAALWGIARLDEGGGDDRYEASQYAQSVAMPGGLSILREQSGNDSYYCKGRYPTGYGDTGIFEGWGQGCAMGFRGTFSGGIAVLDDREGDDRYEAGNFSQGGGYYFGWGMLRDGAGRDRYVGSRYNQGFAAHQALAFFEECAGDDLYETRMAVIAGLSWDETAVVFVERGGNDRYDAGAFSLGATAHNGFCLFLELGGNDTYEGVAPARAGPNEYHGGTSFSLFIDAGGGEDRYEKKAENNHVRIDGKHGIKADLSGSIPD